VQSESVHAPEAQSPPNLQTLPTSQGVQAPPQSTSVSLPFFTMSVHDAATQTPLSHTLLVQSPGAMHVPPVAHGAHFPPPQSTSDSAPSLTWSEQDEPWQRPAVQFPVAQSVGVEQALPDT
jgi:hypothetical protein